MLDIQKKLFLLGDPEESIEKCKYSGIRLKIQGIRFHEYLLAPYTLHPFSRYQER